MTAVGADVVPPNLARVLVVRLEVLSQMTDRPEWLEWAVAQWPGIATRKEPLYIPVTADGKIDPTVVEWAREQYSANTAQSYASDLVLYFRFLGRGRNWLDAGRADIIEFMEDRRLTKRKKSVKAAPGGVSPSTVKRNLVPLRALYDVALQKGLITGNPVPSGRMNATSGRLICDVNWLTRRAYERWRSEGLHGVGSARSETLEMRERNVAYADLLYHTGLRRTECAGLLMFEIPNADFSPRLVRGRVPAALSKGRPARGRVTYLDRVTQRSVESYLSGARAVEVAFGLESGLYERHPDPIIVTRIARAGGIPDKVLITRPAEGNAEQWWRLDDLTMAHRCRMFALDDDGRRRPLMAWLSRGGGPFGHSGWNRVFEDASERTVGARQGFSAGLSILDDTTIRVHPHMLRHSFALYVFALAAHIEMRRRGEMTAGSFDSMVRGQNIWLRVQNLLGHSNIDTTRKYYLAPVLALEWDWFMRAASEAPIDLDETLSSIAALEERVIDA